MDELLSELIKGLDLDSLQAYLDEQGTFSYQSISQILSRLISGDLHLEYDTVVDFLRQIFFQNVETFASVFLTILSILLIYGILRQVKMGTMSDITDQMVFFCCSLAILLPVFNLVSGIVEQTIACTQRLNEQMGLCFPVLLTLMMGSGGTVSVGIYRPAVAILSTVISKIVLNFIFPSAMALIVMTIVSSLSNDFKMKDMQNFIKSSLKWVIGISLSVFTVFLSAQGFVSAQYDVFSLKAIKYAIGNSVPIVGGFLSGEWDLTLAGSSLLKNSVGILGIILIVMEIGTPVFLLCFTDLLLNLCASFAGIFCTDFSPVFQGITDGLHYFLAGLLLVAFLYFLIILLMICSCSLFI